MSHEAPLQQTAVPSRRRSKILQVSGVLGLALALNLVVIALPRRLFVGWGGFGYVGVFIVTLLANASVFIPVPYPGMVARLAVDRNIFAVAILGAAGSALGETTAFLVGRAGKGAVDETIFYRWLQRQLRTPLRSFVVLFVLSAPPNPFFDVAGLTAGSLGVAFPIFVTATFCGRIVRMLALAGLGRTYL